MWKNLKEIQIRPRIAEHDLQTKIRAVRRLVVKNEVRVRLFFRGREVNHPEIGVNLLRRVIDETKDIADVKARHDKDNQLFVILVSNDKNRKTLSKLE